MVTVLGYSAHFTRRLSLMMFLDKYDLFNSAGLSGLLTGLYGDYNLSKGSE